MELVALLDEWHSARTTTLDHEGESPQATRILVHHLSLVKLGNINSDGVRFYYSVRKIGVKTFLS